MTVACGNCGQERSDEQPRTPCPACGVLNLRFEENLAETMRVFDSMKLVHTKPGFPKKKRDRVEEIQGHVLRGDTGEIVHKLRRIDRENNRYDEVVTTLDGEIIRECHETLKEHFGHGSDKKVDKSDT